MPEIRVLIENEIRDLVGLGQDELNAIEAVYPLISAGVGSMPPIQRIDIPERNGEIDIKSAYLPGVDGIAVKVSAGFFDNPSLGLPSLGGLMLVFDSTTGVPAAALFDNGHLTNLRTALAGAVAAKHLARTDASVAGVVGAGVQARLQIEALALVRPISEVRVWARRREAAAELADALAAEHGWSAVPVETVGAAVEENGILVTTTPSTDPLVGVRDLQPGLHITAVGSDAEHKQELTAEAVLAADRFVCDSRSQSARLGELRSVMSGDPTRPGTDGDGLEAVELGEVIDGSAVGRPSDHAITVCDLSGTGAQDTAIASLVVARAREAGVGQVIAT